MVSDSEKKDLQYDIWDDDFFQPVNNENNQDIVAQKTIKRDLFFAKVRDVTPEGDCFVDAGKKGGIFVINDVFPKLRVGDPVVVYPLDENRWSLKNRDWIIQSPIFNNITYTYGDKVKFCCLRETPYNADSIIGEFDGVEAIVDKKDLPQPFNLFDTTDILSLNKTFKLRIINPTSRPVKLFGSHVKAKLVGKNELNPGIFILALFALEKYTSEIPATICGFEESGAIKINILGVVLEVFPNSISWYKNFPKLNYSEGESVIVYFHVDINNFNLIMSFCSTKTGEWDKIKERYPVGCILTNFQYLNFSAKGYIFDIDDSEYYLEGLLIPLETALHFRDLLKYISSIQELIVDKHDEKNRKLILRMNRYFHLNWDLLPFQEKDLIPVKIQHYYKKEVWVSWHSQYLAKLLADNVTRKWGYVWAIVEKINKKEKRIDFSIPEDQPDEGIVSAVYDNTVAVCTQAGHLIQINKKDILPRYIQYIVPDMEVIVFPKFHIDQAKASCIPKEAQIEAIVKSRIKGGLLVEIDDQTGFLPDSQIALQPQRNLNEWIGKTLMVTIIDISENSFVVSRRIILEKQHAQQLSALKEQIQIGQIIKGKVKNIVDYGVFLDIGGFNGLLHLTDISWGRVKHPDEFFKVGDEINVKILSFDIEKTRISLGRKQLTEDPWLSVNEKYAVDQRVFGKVVSLADYGAFVELEEGIEGLLHVSKMPLPKKSNHPSKVVSVGEIVETVVLDIKPENRRISFGVPNPWKTAEHRYEVNTEIAGVITGAADFGVFVELEAGIEGLLHCCEIRRNFKGTIHPFLAKGEPVFVKIVGKTKEDIKDFIKKERLPLTDLQRISFKTLSVMEICIYLNLNSLEEIILHNTIQNIFPDLEIHDNLKFDKKLFVHLIENLEENWSISEKLFSVSEFCEALEIKKEILFEIIKTNPLGFYIEQDTLLKWEEALILIELILKQSQLFWEKLSPEIIHNSLNIRFSGIQSMLLNVLNIKIGIEERKSYDFSVEEFRQIFVKLINPPFRSLKENFTILRALSNRFSAKNDEEINRLKGGRKSIIRRRKNRDSKMIKFEAIPVRKMRVYELAKLLNMKSETLIIKIKALDIDVKSHMTTLKPDVVAKIVRNISNDDNNITPIMTNQLNRISEKIDEKKNLNHDVDDNEDIVKGKKHDDENLLKVLEKMNTRSVLNNKDEQPAHDEDIRESHEENEKTLDNEDIVKGENHDDENLLKVLENMYTGSVSNNDKQTTHEEDTKELHEEKNKPVTDDLMKIVETIHNADSKKKIIKRKSQSEPAKIIRKHEVKPVTIVDKHEPDNIDLLHKIEQLELSQQKENETVQVDFDNEIEHSRNIEYEDGVIAKLMEIYSFCIRPLQTVITELYEIDFFKSINWLKMANENKPQFCRIIGLHAHDDNRDLKHYFKDHSDSAKEIIENLKYQIPDLFTASKVPAEFLNGLTYSFFHTIYYKKYFLPVLCLLGTNSFKEFRISPTIKVHEKKISIKGNKVKSIYPLPHFLFIGLIQALAQESSEYWGTDTEVSIEGIKHEKHEFEVRISVPGWKIDDESDLVTRDLDDGGDIQNVRYWLRLIDFLLLADSTGKSVWKADRRHVPNAIVLRWRECPPYRKKRND